jgi:RHH-type proline utilization regulon transcriptional repressor/proline dehydrogenase/delta 1-pyrroline-5-carboxylate dehydrogenase
MTINSDQLESEVRQYGEDIFASIAPSAARVFDPNHYTEKFMNWAMQDEALKVSLFRFVDVLPNLPDSASIVRHVQEYFGHLEGSIPDILRKAMNISPNSLTAKLAAPAIKKQVRFVSQRFIVGEDPKKAVPALRKIRKRGLAFTVDLVGEAAVSGAEARAYADRYLELLDRLAAECPKWKESAPLVANHRCEDTPINISVKLSALYSQAKAVSTDYSIDVLSERLAEILGRAKEIGAFVYVDMEDCALTEITLKTFRKTLERPEFRDYPRCGIVMQAYLRRTKDDLKELISWVRPRGVPVAVRLVKGAYWDTETILAKQHGWPIPVWQKKMNSDANYEDLSLMLLNNIDVITPAFASHNIRSLCHAIKAAELLGVEPHQFELQTLYGMADEIKTAFSKRGLLVREYAPVGELIPGMGYLVRRLLENTSNEGFLKQSMYDGIDAASLLEKPLFDKEDTGRKHIPDDKTLLSGGEQGIHFRNTPLRDFTIIENRQRLQDELSKLSNLLSTTPATVKPILGGKKQSTNNSIKSINPSQTNQVLASIELADIALANEAVAKLELYRATWRNTPVAERADILRKTAALLEDKREEAISLIILEAGKPWVEADGDVAEAIDFLNYYAREAVRLMAPRAMGDLPGEDNSYFYEPRGITLVISPWNFPLAIPCGMLSAALVTGNCAILKPAEQTSLIAQFLFETFLSAGLPPEAAAFLPGLGEEVGAHLSTHESIDTVVFTGSKDVGLTLIENGAKRDSSGQHVRRVIAEMGGKNAIIVDEDADLDEAVKGVLYSAFGFQGQKCSACSRAIVVGGTYDRFLERLSNAVESIHVGISSDPKTFVGPLIDKESVERLKNAVATLAGDCRLLAQGKVAEEYLETFIFPPSVIADVPQGHPLLHQEFFGPLLAVSHVDTFEEAIALAMDSEYGLTGGVFSRSPKNIQIAVEQFRVGNLYINRACTGALVYRQAFGGAKMSGVGSKAGGPDYLQQFVIPRAVSENAMRRGFAPL